ncbi:hypothetical protein [Thalassospira australica]|uniref:hypothetical protein n=1 Tax=Thalassospira australica TaxID=1528106 RepID=UPI00384C777D
MTMHVSTHSLGATAPHAGPTANASFGTVVWRWLVLSIRHIAKRRKIARDAVWLRQSSSAILHDIGITRDEIDQALRYGRPQSRS